MPSWLVIQLSIIVVWILVGVLTTRGMAWRSTGFPFNRKDIQSIILGLIVPFAILLTTIITGLMLYIFWPLSANVAMIWSMIVLPVFLFISYSLFMAYKAKANKKAQKQREEQLLQTIRECNEWVGKFPFIDTEKADINIYLANGRPQGRVTIDSISQSEASYLEGHRNELPSGIHLALRPKNPKKKI